MAGTALQTAMKKGADKVPDRQAKGALGRSPVTFKLLPGSYTIIAEMPGHESAKQRVERATDGRCIGFGLFGFGSFVAG